MSINTFKFIKNVKSTSLVKTCNLKKTRYINPHIGHGKNVCKVKMSRHIDMAKTHCTKRPTFDCSDCFHLLIKKNSRKDRGASIPYHNEYFPFFGAEDGKKFHLSKLTSVMTVQTFNQLIGPTLYEVDQIQ